MVLPGRLGGRVGRRRVYIEPPFFGAGVFFGHELRDRLDAGGEFFLSNAVIGGVYALRLCVVNFRTSLEDMERLPEEVKRLGAKLDGELRPLDLK